MPRGLKRIAKIAEESKARQEARSSGDGYQRALYLKPGQVATGRFCEGGEDVTYVYTHDLPLTRGQKFADRILCLDQDDAGAPCYACERGDVKRGTRLVMNFIRFDEPKLLRGADGKAIKDNFDNYQYEMVPDPSGEMVQNPTTGLTTPKMIVATEFALVIFQTGSSAGGRLAFLESQKGDLKNHVMTIARTSDNTSPYMIDIAEANKLPPSDEEIALFNKKVDPIKAITQLGKLSVQAKSYGDMVRDYGGSSAGAFSTDSSGNQVTPENNVYAKAEEEKSAGKLDLGAFG